MFDEIYILFHFNIILNTTGCPILKLAKTFFAIHRAQQPIAVPEEPSTDITAYLSSLHHNIRGVTG